MGQSTRTIFERVQLIISDQLMVLKSAITPDTHFVRDLNTDDLDKVELAMELEDHFDILLLDEDVENAPTVGQVVSIIEKRVQGRTV